MSKVYLNSTFSPVSSRTKNLIHMHNFLHQGRQYCLQLLQKVVCCQLVQADIDGLAACVLNEDITPKEMSSNEAVKKLLKIKRTFDDSFNEIVDRITWKQPHPSRFFLSLTLIDLIN